MLRPEIEPEGITTVRAVSMVGPPKKALLLGLP